MRGRKVALRVVMVRRVFQLRRTVKVDTQEIRRKTVGTLEELFDLSSALAKGDVKQQGQDGHVEKLSFKQRQMWARVAAYIAQIMNSVAEALDERQVDADLQELERLVNEAKAKAKNEECCEGDSGAGETQSPRGFG